MPPEDRFDSVCGTESNQRLPVVTFAAAKGDLMARMMRTNGHIYGKQFVVYESCQAYPAYVVTYTCPDNSTPSPELPRMQVPVTIISESSTAHSLDNDCRSQAPLKWEHKASTEDTWSEYSPSHSALLTQVGMFLVMFNSSASAMANITS